MRTVPSHRQLPVKTFLLSNSLVGRTDKQDTNNIRPIVTNTKNPATCKDQYQKMASWDRFKELEHGRPMVTNIEKKWCGEMILQLNLELNLITEKGMKPPDPIVLIRTIFVNFFPLYSTADFPA